MDTNNMKLFNGIKLYKKEILAFWIIGILFCISIQIGFKNYLKFLRLKKEYQILKKRNEKLKKYVSEIKEIKNLKVKENIFEQKIPYSHDTLNLLNCFYEKNIIFVENFKIENICEEKKCIKYLKIHGKKITIYN